ncbi:MAG TPA: deoxynucleoside kinase [Ktedonobacteraceae bacterium]|nr:deoxynucleoside kinase [Ktedonobacteraceae bacterium]
MVRNVFVLGRTGSGKSTVVRFLRETVQQFGWSVKTFNDYPILREMYESEARRSFRPTDHDGFEVLDLSVYETAIRSLAQQVQSYCPINDRTFNTVEFTSNNYRDALQFFDNTLLQDAYFIFVAADLKTCLERTSKRAFYRATEDDYYVIDSVLLSHYPCPYVPPCINKGKVTLIENMGLLDEVRFTMNRYVLRLLEHDGQSYLSVPEYHLSAAFTDKCCKW